VDHSRAVLAVPGTTRVFDPPPRFSIDGITEKLHLFSCEKEEEIKNLMKKHSSFFLQSQGGGLMCLLYSIVMSKGLDSLLSDMQGQGHLPLVMMEDEITLCLSNLMLTGTATPYLHNGSVTQDGNEYGDGLVGIQGRTDIGFLIWEKDEDITASLNLGSRLKTSFLPIWLTRVNGNWGVLFNPNKDLMKSYSAENKFHLYYFSNEILKEKKDTILDINTRGKKVVKDKVADVDDCDGE